MSGGIEQRVDEMMGASAFCVRGKWLVTQFDGVGERALRTIAIAGAWARSYRWRDHAIGLIACEDGAGAACLGGLVVVGGAWGFGRPGVVRVGDRLAVTSTRGVAREVFESEDFERFELRARIGVFRRPSREASGFRIEVPRAFTTTGASKWQFELVDSTPAELRIVADATEDATLTELLPRPTWWEVTDRELLGPAPLDLTNVRVGQLGTPLLGVRLREELLRRPEEFRWKLVSAVLAERVRYVRSSGGA